MTNKYLILIYLCVYFVLPGCQKGHLFRDDGYIHDQPSNQGVQNALDKARLVAEVEWTPINPVPSQYSSPYTAGITRQGLPYSLAQKVNGYVGMDVSFYSFLSAVNNPRSVMYTEDLRLPPYYGFDCASYYGSVCSMSVWYVLGIKATYFTSSINSIPDLKRENTLGVDSIQLCDVLWKSGHVAMIYDIGRDDTGAIASVAVFETTRRNQLDSGILYYSYEEFVERWNQDGWVIYRPRLKTLSNNPPPDLVDRSYFWGVKNFITPSLMNIDLCTNHGDRVSYPVGDSIVINILADSCQYSCLNLYKDGVLYQSIHGIDSLETMEDVVLYDLPYGSYYAFLKGERGNSNIVSFEVIDVNVSFINEGNTLTVNFSSANASPVFLAIVNSYESPHYCHEFTDEQLANGSASIPLQADDYLKVFFKGEYGRVSNKKIKVK